MSAAVRSDDLPADCKTEFPPEDYLPEILHPQILWAQRKNEIYLTIDIEDMEVETLKIEDENKLVFKGFSMETINLTS